MDAKTRLRGLRAKYRVIWDRTKGWDGRTYSADHFRVALHGQDETGFPTEVEVEGPVPINPKLFGRD